MMSVIECFLISYVCGSENATVCTVDVANWLEVGRVKAGVIVDCLGEFVHESPTLKQIDIEQDLEPPLLV